MATINKTVPAKGNILGTLIPARYILAILGSIGMSIVYGLKVNLSVAMVAMLNHTAIKNGGLQSSAITSPILASVTQNLTAMNEQLSASTSSLSSSGDDSCFASNSSSITTIEDGPFDWSEPLQGTILSCYFWGYFISQIPGARVAEQFSAKWVMFFSVAINIVCTLLTPWMARVDYIAMILMRIGEGIGGGVTFPAMHVMLASWAPPDERSIMSSIVYAGTSLGTVASMLMAGFLAGNYGWEFVFYVMGLLSLIWVVLWIWLVQDTPNQQPLISEDERTMITSSLKVMNIQTTPTSDEEGEMVGSGSGDGDGKKPKLPWKLIFTSGPFLAILIAHVCSNWGWYMLLIELPFYMKQVLKFNIKENAMATAFPFLTMWFFSMALSKTLDTLRTKGKITTTTARKVATLFASAVPMICLLALCYIGCQRGLAVFLMGVAITSIGGMFCGFLSNHIDLAPNFAGTLMAITNTAATIPGIIVPIFVGDITHGNQTIGAWRIIFFVTIVLYIIEIIAYTLMGSGELQSWNSGDNTEHKRSESKTPFAAEETPLNVRNTDTKTTNYSTTEETG